ncbi:MULTISPECIES: DNA mismatch repair endonuclease MutL [unclassified Paenibacillus]|uniref:DNA mismatch repair endonuclease MutL n=1 Tax=unclassified Paenibacillus TaxID=185978 RepID=UPI001AE9FFBF|nr:MULTISPECIES: DNA mismatch repair endonuclease MutL [unclassified Paenibacillus]MBP1155437.1 DNA mismatch repair protein MutL [Paenibacillus sp. PvP091]MBP1169178.1 DNA mismatch repair protein MutL [Paenibacillus sp. PvR098]MBP2440206.1 DNA mismatch repair protein MutL [Paenibacillus sp. PvP052]
MGKITILDEHIANQIAAGEVVERPSSVVKELVENAIDAGSSRIDVSIEEGGLQLIRVTDNGSGMDREDCETAFYRHATSKIASTHDLFQIRTLGFRGEALPSIGAVAKVELLTSPDSSGLGTRLVMQGGSVLERSDATAPQGTDITVRELFYNTPARLKYMKTIQTELGHVTDYIYRLALAHPGIAITLKHNGNVLAQTPGGGDLLQTIAAIYGTAVAKSMLPISGETLDYRLEGYIAKPEITRANRGGMTTVINGRYIRNFPMVQALLQGYHTLLPIGRFPVAVLHVQMDPTLIDVNVHPAKLEVRFSKEPELMQLVERETRETLGRQRLIPSAGQPGGAGKRPREPLVQEQLELYRPQATAAAERLTGAVGEAPRAPWTQPPLSERTAFADPPARRDAPAPARPEAPRERLQPREAAVASGALLRTLAPELEGPPALPDFPKLSPIGQLHGTYIVAQNEEGLFLIDQHAAHERINYERYFDMFGKPEEASQELLVPITLEFTAIEAAKLSDKLPQLEQAGVFLEPFGGTSFLVRAYPHWLPKGDEQAIVEEMIEWLMNEKKQVDIGKLREKAAIMCSCKASIKANQSIGTLEIETLLDRLAACRNPYTCPHGRPIVVSFSTYELEKMFKRVQ